MVAYREQDALAKRLIEQNQIKKNIEPRQLTIHADQESSIKSKAVTHLLADLVVTKTHSRPHVSNDNPYSEMQFKTLRYYQKVSSFWHALMTPKQVHYGLAEQIYHHRSKVLETTFNKHPSYFKYKVPVPKTLPRSAWINKPSYDDIIV